MRSDAKARLAIDALLTGKSITDAAKQAGVHRNTLALWMRDSAFLAEVHRTEAEAVTQLGRSLITLSSKAVETLAEVLEDPTAGAAARVRAADVVISRLMTLKELIDLDERIRRLEESNDEKSNQSH